VCYVIAAHGTDPSGGRKKNEENGATNIVGGKYPLN